MMYCFFPFVQALGMKLLRKKDVPDYKVLAVIWHFFFSRTRRRAAYQYIKESGKGRALQLQDLAP
jgi:hypothetical protein